MKIKNLFLGLLLVAAVSANAQIKVGGSLGLQAPMGDFGDVASTGFGFNVMGSYAINEELSVGALTGYSTFGFKEVAGFKPEGSFSIIPLVVNGQYNFLKMDKITFFGGADLGLYICKSEMTMPSVSFMGVSVGGGKISTSESYIGFAPFAGASFELNDKLDLFGNLKYNYINSDTKATTVLGINVGVTYKL